MSRQVLAGEASARPQLVHVRAVERGHHRHARNRSHQMDAAVALRVDDVERGQGMEGFHRGSALAHPARVGTMERQRAHIRPEVAQVHPGHRFLSDSGGVRGRHQMDPAATRDQAAREGPNEIRNSSAHVRGSDRRENRDVHGTRPAFLAVTRPPASYVTVDLLPST